MLRANKESLPFLQEIVGEWESIYFKNDSDILEMTLISGKGDIATHFIADLIVDKLVFGLRALHDAQYVINQDPNPDERFLTKPDNLYPPKGYDGFVVFNPDICYRTVKDKKKVAIRAILLHELAENYAKVHYLLQYKHAHAYAVNFEKLLVRIRPGFTNGLAGEMLEKYKGE
jgi:hypothetical protein